MFKNQNVPILGKCFQINIYIYIYIIHENMLLISFKLY